MAGILAGCGYDALVALNGRFGINLLDHQKVDVVVIDFEMAETDGDRVAREISRREPHVPIVLISEYNEIPAEVAGHVQAFVERLSRTQQLLDRVETAITIKGQQMLSTRCTAPDTTGHPDRHCSALSTSVSHTRHLLSHSNTLELHG